MASPSRYRREGRNAFYLGGDAEQACPYLPDTFLHRNDWLDGWKEAERVYVPPKEYVGYLGAMRDEYSDETINAMTNVELLEAIDAIEERNLKGF